MMESEEDSGTLAYFEDTARQAGLATTLLDIEDIGLSEDRRFVDLDNRPIELAFKLYPWEWMFHVAAVAKLNLVGGDLFQTGDKPERDCLGLVGAGAEHQQRGELLAGSGVGSGIFFRHLMSFDLSMPVLVVDDYATMASDQVFAIGQAMSPTFLAKSSKRPSLTSSEIRLSKLTAGAMHWRNAAS